MTPSVQRGALLGLQAGEPTLRNKGHPSPAAAAPTKRRSLQDHPEPASYPNPAIPSPTRPRHSLLWPGQMGP